MKKVNVLVLGLVTVFAAASCIKDGDSFDLEAQYELEKPVVEEYALANLDNPEYIDIQGKQLWYEVVELGDPESYQYKGVPHPNDPSQYIPEAPVVKVIYAGKLVESDVLVDSNEDAEGDERSLGSQGIPTAWVAAFFPEEIIYDEDGELLEEPIPFGGITQEGLKAGSIIRIVSPSYFLYANQSYGKVPANSPMYYEIEVVSIEAPDDDSNQ